MKLRLYGNNQSLKVPFYNFFNGEEGRFDGINIEWILSARCTSLKHVILDKNDFIEVVESRNENLRNQFLNNLYFGKIFNKRVTEQDFSKDQIQSFMTIEESLHTVLDLNVLLEIYSWYIELCKNTPKKPILNPNNLINEVILGFNKYLFKF